MSTRNIRILIADDHRLFREAVSAMLREERGFEVVGEAANGEELIRLAEQVPADVLLLDLAMPGLSGLDALERLVSRGFDAHTIILAGHVQPGDAVRALRLGARGVVLKDAPIDLLTRAIRGVVAGQYWVGHDRMADVVHTVRSGHRQARPSSAATLTRRELQLVSAVVQGATNREIATQFGLREQTVKNHLSNIFGKLGVSSRLELALLAVDQKLVADPRDA